MSMTDLDPEPQFKVTDIPVDQVPPGFGDQPKDEPPKRNSAQSRSRSVNAIIESMEKGYLSLGVGVQFFDEQAGILIVRSAGDLAESWRTVLESDTKLRRKFEQMIKGTGWGAVIIAHAMVALPIMQAHGLSLSHLIQSRKDDEAPEPD